MIDPDPNDEHACLIRVKAVPGASRDQIAGPLGDRLKVRVSAPPEGGKANKAIAKLLAKALALRPADVELISAPSNPEKTFRARGISPDDARTKLAI